MDEDEFYRRVIFRPPEELPTSSDSVSMGITIGAGTSHAAAELQRNDSTSPPTLFNN